ncbi:MAG: Hpt domain-containing protein [Gammaproteobacteria bacterium]|nr:Hpt domain-containing protein [Gammaproteobacteria bacterium]
MASESGHLDLEVLEELKDVMEDEFVELLTTYLSDAEVKVAGLKSALAENHHENLRNFSHSFKGSSGNLGIQLLAELCAQVEALAKDERSSDAGAYIDEIDAEFQLVAVEMQKIIAQQ